MKKLIATTLLSCTALLGFAQGTSLSEIGCGTITSQQELEELEAFVKAPPFANKTTAVDTIPLTIHIVGDDDGRGYYRLDNLFTVICELNDHYAPANMYFSIKWPIRYIDNSNFYDHDFNTGYSMMASNNITKTINVYFVDDPAGNCGYYSPQGGAVAIKKNCALPKSTTLVHELGHYLGLPHTFSGWEGRDMTNPPSSPELVTRGAGANCSSRGDRFCDTDADYLSGRWNCPYGGNYTDANGDLYKPDGSLYMSYADDACMTHFSPQQIGAMQNRLHTTYSNVLNAAIPAYTTFTAPNVVYPTSKIYSNYTKLIWNKVKGAESYHIKISSGVLSQYETVTSDTSIDLTFTLTENRNYTFKITPMNGVNVCRQSMSTAEKTFPYSNETTTLSVSEIGSTHTQVAVTPNPANSQLAIHMNDFAGGAYSLTMHSVNGQQMYHQSVNHPGGNVSVDINVNNLPAGMYFIRINGEGKSFTEKVMVQH